MTEPKPPPMIELRVPVGHGPDEVFTVSVPVYFGERPSLELLEFAIQSMAKQAVDLLRAEMWLWEAT